MTRISHTYGERLISVRLTTYRASFRMAANPCTPVRFRPTPPSRRLCRASSLAAKRRFCSDSDSSSAFLIEARGIKWPEMLGHAQRRPFRHARDAGDVCCRSGAATACAAVRRSARLRAASASARRCPLPFASECCARYRGRLSIIASIEDPAAIARILAYLERTWPQRHSAAPSGNYRWVRGHGRGRCDGAERSKAGLKDSAGAPGEGCERSRASRPDYVSIGRTGGTRDVGGDRAQLESGPERSPTGPRRLGGALTAVTETQAATLEPVGPTIRNCYRGQIPMPVVDATPRPPRESRRPALLLAHEASYLAAPARTASLTRLSTGVRGWRDP